MAGIKKGNPVRDKSYEFALSIIKLYKFLVEQKKEYVLSKQILRSGTSIGANIEEALGGQSRKDFFAKMSIAYKEARETDYWLRLLYDAGIIPIDKIINLTNDCNELLKLIGTIQKTTRINS